MGFLLDGILVALILIFAVVGVRRGLFRSIRGILCAVCSFGTAMIFCRRFGDYLNRVFFSPRVQKIVSDALTRATGGAPVEQVLEEKPDILTDFLRTFSATLTQIQEKTAQLLADHFGDVGAAVARAVADPISEKLSYAVAFLLLFLAASLLFGLLFRLIGGLLHLPVLRQADHLLGLFGGAVGGVLVCWVLSCVFSMFLPYLSANFASVFPADLGAKTKIFHALTEYNFFTFLLG